MFADGSIKFGWDCFGVVVSGPDFLDFEGLEDFFGFELENGHEHLFWGRVVRGISGVMTFVPVEVVVDDF